MANAERRARPGGIDTQALVCVLAGAAIWLVTRRDTGLHNDAALYGLSAMAWRWPADFGGDLFVAFGSQASFSLFIPIYGTLIGLVGLTAASTGLLLGAHALWLTGAWMLTHRLLRGAPAHLAFVVVAAIAAQYGGWGVLYAGEGVLTPRPLAEALTMIALARGLKRAWLSAGAALALAAVLHPMMALGGLATAFIGLALKWRRLWWLAPAGVAAGLVLAAWGVAPFDRAFEVMDGRWLAAARAHNGFIFPDVWFAADWVRMASEAAVCLAAALWSGGGRRRLLLAATATAAAGLALTQAGAEWANNVLVIQLNTWRMAWPMALLSLPAVLILALRLRRRTLGWAAVALLAAPLVILTRPFCDKAWAWAIALVFSLAGLALAWLIRQGRQPALSATARRLIVEAALILPAGAAVDSLINLGQDLVFHARHGVFSLDPTMFIGVRLALLAAGVALALSARRRPAAALAGAGTALILGAAAWDGRTAWDRYIESGAKSPLDLPPAAAVLWADEANPPWFLLRRPAYVSSAQAASLGLSQATAMEWLSRARAVRPLVRLEAWSPSSRLADCAQRLAPAGAAELAQICARAPGLAGMVLPTAPTGVRATAFATAVPEPIACMTGETLQIRRVTRFAYVACADLARPPVGR